MVASLEKTPTQLSKTAKEAEQVKQDKQKRDAQIREDVTNKIQTALHTDVEVVRMSKTGRRKTVVVSAIGDRQTITARELWLYCVGEGKPIDWIESYKALLKYVSKDYKDIFNPRIDGSESGTRYKVKVNDVIEFLYKFETNTLKS